MKQAIILLTIVLYFVGCKKEDTGTKLPDATRSGANTFGCKIDGEIFTVSGKSYLGQHDGVKIQPSSTYAWLIEGALSSKEVALQFDFNINPSVPGTFLMAGEYPYQAHYFYHANGTVPTGSTDYETNSIHNGTVTVTDYTSAFASGTFAFDAINSDGKIVHITEGRFDISF